jgi:hypothetical protein
MFENKLINQNGHGTKKLNTSDADSAIGPAYFFWESYFFLLGGVSETWV